MTACLTGYTLADLARLERSSVTCAHFFQRAPAMNPDRALITDKVCGVRVSGQAGGRAAQGTPMEQILRKNKYVPELLAFQKLGAVFASRALCFAAEKGQRFPMHWLFRAL